MSDISIKNNADDNLTLEERLGLEGLSEEDFNERIDKYLISLFNKKEKLGKKEFSEKVIEIYQTTDWCDGEDIEIPYEETEEDLKRYNLSLAEMHDSDMSILACTAYRKLMHNFNDNLVNQYPELDINNKKWEFEFDLDEEDIETINSWKNGQIAFHFRDSKEKYIDEHYQDILKAVDLKQIIEKFFIDNSFIKKEQIVYGTESSFLEELEKLFKDDSYLIKLFGRGKHYIFDEYRKLDSSPEINFLGKKLEGKELLSVFLQSGSTRIIPEDCIKAGYESIEEFQLQLEKAKEEFFGEKKYWPEFSKTNSLKLKSRKSNNELIADVKHTKYLKEFESLISDTKRYYNAQILDIGEDYEYELDFDMYKDKVDIETIEFYDRNYEEIKKFIEENFSRNFFNEIALERGYSIGKFKELSVSIYKGEYVRFSEEKKNQKIIKEFKNKNSQLRQVCNHIENRLGPITSIIDKKETEDLRVYILYLSPSLNNPHHTFITCGMSNYTITAEGYDDLKTHLEVSLRLPKQWKIDENSLKDKNYNWPIKLLFDTAFYPLHSKAYIAIGHSINSEDSFPDGWDFKSIVLSPSIDLSDIIIEQNKIDFVNLTPIFQEERDLKLANIEEFSKRIFAKRENDIFLFDPERDSFAKDIKEFTKNKNNDSLDMEDEELDPEYIGIKNWIENIFKRANQEEVIITNLEMIKYIDDNNQKNKSQSFTDNNKFQRDEVHAIALQIALNATQMIYERGKEAAIERLANDILIKTIVDYAPDAIPLALDCVILLWGLEHQIPNEEAKNMRIKALRLSHVIAYRKDQSKLKYDRFLSSGKYLLTKQNDDERIKRLILKARDFVNTDEEVFEGENDGQYYPEFYGGVVAVTNAVLKEIETTEDEDSVINVLATSLGDLIGTASYILIIWLTYDALQDEANFSDEEAGNFINKAKLEGNILFNKQEEGFLKNIKLDDKTTFIQRIIWKVKYWFNWLTAKKRPATFPASSLYRFKYLEPKSLYRGLPEEEVSLILEKAGGLDMHTTLLTWANKKISRGSIRNFNELIDAKDYLNIKGWIGLLRTKYDNTKSSHIIDFLLNAFIDALLFVYLPFFVYKLSFIYTPLIILISALFLRPISSFDHCNSDVYLPLDLDTAIETDNFSKSKKKKIYQLLGFCGYIIYYFSFKLISLNFIGFLLIFLSCILLLYSNSLNIYIYKLRKYGLGEVLAEMTKARKSIGLPF